MIQKKSMQFLSLFSGIGGLDLGLERASMRCIAQCEIDPFCRKVLAKHWPDVQRFEDVRSLHGSDIRERVDLIAGGFPCQDVSHAGFGAGLAGARSGLWSEFFRLICEIRPRYILVENVSALLGRGMGKVLADLASSGHDAEWRVFSCSEFGMPHERNRLFIIAYTDKKHGAAGMGSFAERKAQIFRENPKRCVDTWLQAPPRNSGMDDGIPARLYAGRVGGLGNAVSPVVAEWIGKRIMEVA